ncbi:MAG TPA: SPOR domain-containing protein [Blastocatellia bacterium]|nr:SPOR domain-containing protein [Blastocatellia bacterium]
MRFKLVLLLTASFLLSPDAVPGARRQAIARRYTIQVASFSNPAQAHRLTARLAGLGEHATEAVVDLADLGRWTRVFVGSFASVAEARRYADILLRGGVITEFLVTPDGASRQELGDAIKLSARASTATGSAATSDSGYAASKQVRVVGSELAPPASASGLLLNASRQRMVSNSHVATRLVDWRTVAIVSLPLAKKLKLSLMPSPDTRFLPRPEPVSLAFRLITGNARSAGGPAQKGGLWVTGDPKEGLARLRWIAGADCARLITLDSGGRVKLDLLILAEIARAEQFAPIEAPLAVTDYIYSNEGLLLLVQLTEGLHRYRLHIGPQAPTRGAAVEVSGSINLDNNFDSRINPRRRLGAKLDRERPPEGFDSLIAINPVARWFNQDTGHLVPVGNITFHELAEAHAKLELGLDYLVGVTRPGAHVVALEREQRLKSQRPLADVVITAGPNRVLRSEEEFRAFSQSLGSSNQR